MNNNPSILILAVLSVIAVTFAAFWEVGVSMCMPAAVFAGYGLFWTVVLLPFLLRQPSRLKSLFYFFLLVSLLVLYLVPWNSRKPFLRDLAKVEIGISAGEVEEIMGKYIKGTGWPANPFPDPDSSTGTLTEADLGITLVVSNLPSGELVIQDSIAYRHSNDGAFNSDWAVVQYKDGRVFAKEFMPD